MLELGLGLDLGELNVDDMATPLVRNGLDAGGLAGARRTVEHEAKCIGDALAVIPLTVLQEELGASLDMLALLKEDVVKGAVGRELRLRIQKVRGRQGILHRALDLGLNDLIEEVPMRSQLVREATLVVHRAGLKEGLEILDVVRIRHQLKLHNLGSAVLELELQELKEEIRLHLNGVILVRKVIVVGHSEETLDRRERRDKLDDGIHSDLIGSCLCGTLSVRNGLNPAFAQNRGRGLWSWRRRPLEEHWERFARQE